MLGEERTGWRSVEEVGVGSRGAKIALDEAVAGILRDSHLLEVGEE